MTAAVILAGGSSSRLGQPKQVLKFKEKSLLQHSIDAAINAGCNPVMVVIGANDGDIRASVKNEPIQLVENHLWEEGISSSICAGITELLSYGEEIESVILMVCDQPYVNKSLLRHLLDTKQTTGKPIVACSYTGTAGVPALFERTLFSELVALQGEEGGKKVLLKYTEDTALIPFPEGAVDIDTAEDYQRLLGTEK